MLRLTLWVLVIACAASTTAHAAEKKCELQRYGQLPVTMVGTQPLITGTINGQPARFLADSGAFFSILTERAAQRLGLKYGLPPRNVRVIGTGGSTSMLYTKVRQFTLDGLAGGRVIQQVDFLVDELVGFESADGIIGQNVLGGADTEFDLANGMIRLFRAKNCKQSLAYWAGGAPVAEMTIRGRSPGQPHLIGEAKLNGQKIRVLFDTGASYSKLSLNAAARAGVTPEDDGVREAGFARGIGPRTNENSIARFETLDLGGEMIKNARLRMGEMNLAIADMLLGADFFLSHRVYVASDQNKLYFTYNGGPVFDLRPRTAASGAGVDAGAESSATAEDAPQLSADELRRRGAASSGRRDFAAAIADFDRSIALDPNQAETFYQRGVAYWASGRPELARADFDAALELNPSYVDARLTRGTHALRRDDESGAAADFQRALQDSAGDPAIAFRVAQIYQSAGFFEQSIERLNAWVAEHPKHDRLADALASRCLSRAVLGKQLDEARVDCDQALKKGPRNSDMFDSRGFVRLQLGDFDKAIADYKAALKMQPKKASALYGLGLAQVKTGRSEGERNMQAALEIDAQAAAPFTRLGLGALTNKEPSADDSPAQ